MSRAPGHGIHAATASALDRTTKAFFAAGVNRGWLGRELGPTGLVPLQPSDVLLVGGKHHQRLIDDVWLPLEQIALADASTFLSARTGETAESSLGNPRGALSVNTALVFTGSRDVKAFSGKPARHGHVQEDGQEEFYLSVVRLLRGKSEVVLHGPHGQATSLPLKKGSRIWLAYSTRWQFNPTSAAAWGVNQMRYQPRVKARTR